MRLLNGIWEVILALLASAGLLALAWVSFGRLLLPVGTWGPAYAVVPASGDGAGLEQAVKGLLWLRGAGLAQFTVVIADGGLDPAGRALASALMNGRQGVLLCPAEQLWNCLRPEIGFDKLAGE